MYSLEHAYWKTFPGGSVAHSWLLHCHNCFHRHSKLTARCLSYIKSHQLSPLKTFVVSLRLAESQIPPLSSLCQQGLHRGLSARHSLGKGRKGVYPCSALQTQGRAIMAKAVGGRWSRGRTGSPGMSSPWKQAQAPTHPRRGTAQLSPLPPPKTSDGTEGGSGKERIWKEEEGQKDRGRESLSILRTHRIHHFLFQSLPGVLVSTRRCVCMYVCMGGQGVEGKILFSCVQMCSKSTIIFLNTP